MPLCCFFGAIGAFVSSQIMGLEHHPLSIVALSVMIGFSQLVAAVIQARGQTLLSVIAFPSGGYVIASILILVKVSPPDAILIGNSCGFVFGFCLIASLLLRHLGEFQVRWLIHAKYYYALGINRLSFDWGLNLLVVGTLGTTEAVTFAMASRIAAILSLPMTALNNYLLPIFAIDAKSSQSKNTKKISQNILGICFVAQIASGIAAVVLINNFSSFGQFDNAMFVGVVIPMAFAQVANVLTGPVGAILMMTGECKYVAVVSATSAFLTVGIGSLVVGNGVTALAIVLAIFWTLQNLAFAIRVFQRDKIIPIRDLFVTLKSKMTG